MDTAAHQFENLFENIPHGTFMDPSMKFENSSSEPIKCSSKDHVFVVLAKNSPQDHTIHASGFNCKLFGSLMKQAKNSQATDMINEFINYLMVYHLQ